MADEAVNGFGARFFLHDGSSYVELDGVVSVTPPSPKVGSDDSTHHGSAGGVRTKIPGLIEYGPLSVRLFWNPNNTTDQKLLAAIAARTARNFKLAVPEADGTFQMQTGSCIPGGIDYDEVVVEGKMTYLFTAEVSGAVTQADYS